MKKFEYKTITLSQINTAYIEGRKNNKNYTRDSFLNELGNQGFNFSFKLDDLNFVFSKEVDQENFLTLSGKINDSNN